VFGDDVVVVASPKLTASRQQATRGRASSWHDASLTLALHICSTQLFITFCVTTGHLKHLGYIAKKLRCTIQELLGPP
jgi:hypothetical protein